MAAGPASQDSREAIERLERQAQELRDRGDKARSSSEQIERKLRDLVDDVDDHRTFTRALDAKVGQLRNLPEQLRGLNDRAERQAQELAATRAELANAVRLLQAEASVHREESAEAIRRIESAASQLSLLAADISQVQAQVTNASQAAQTVLERQRIVESSVEQLALRLARSLEVHKDLEERVRTALLDDQEARFEVVFERLQVIGEMVRRNEELIREATAEQTVREDVLHEVGVWRDQHTRLEARLGELEQAADEALGRMDRLQAEITLVEGRHTGLSERVATIRRDIAEVVDQVRVEFTNFGQMLEKQRRKQIQNLEQDLREMKFHAFHPPEEK